MKVIQRIILISLLVLIFCMSFTTSNDFSQDLGRHLKLGEIIFQTHKIPKTNLFSYTNPAFPFINHHWGAEVFFYLLVKYIGLYSLTILKVLVMLLTCLFLMKSNKKEGSVLGFSIASLLFFPLLLDRLDIRPELFGYLFFSLFLYILFYQKNKKLLIFIPLIFMIWINTHITFVFGLILLFVYAFFNLRKKTKQTSTLLLCSTVALCINPHGINGLLYPFNIFGNYGYTIVENQNLFFLNSATFNPLIRYFFIISPLILISLFILFSRKKYEHFILLLIFFILPFWQIRHMPFFVFVAVLSVGKVAHYLSLIIKIHKKHVSIFHIVLTTIILVNSYLYISDIYYHTFDKKKEFGLGFEESQKKATDFLLKEKLSGNLFNNFDIGGYLIYRLYPTYKVFVDNRPEGYPAQFFLQTYIPLQENQEVRRRLFNKYDIHTVFFAHTDMTPWGIAFLTNILQDKSWRVVFLNESIVIITDEKRFTDIRDSDKFTSLINKTENYIALLQLSTLFSLMDKKEMSMQAFVKAQKINPASCSIKRTLYNNLQSIPVYFLQSEIKSSSWWCF